MRVFVDFRQNVSLEALLSSGKEQSDWFVSGMPRYHHASEASMLMRLAAQACREHCPLLIDPDGHSIHWLSVIEKVSPRQVGQGPGDVEHESGNGERSLVVVHAKHPQLGKYMVSAMKNGDVLLIDHVEIAVFSSELHDLLEKRTTFNDVGKVVNVVGGELVDASPSFAVYLRSAVCLSRLDKKGKLVRGCVVDLSLGADAMVDLLVDHLVSIKHPEHLKQLRYLDSEMATQRLEQQTAEVSECICEGL